MQNAEFADHTKFMNAALIEAQKAFEKNEVPIGAVVVCDNHIIARAHNTREQDKNPLHHAEIKALQVAAQKKQDWRLNDCDLYVTLEPCPMCLGALYQARVRKLIVGAMDPKREENVATQNLTPNLLELISQNKKVFSNNHSLEEIVLGVLEEPCAQILKDFFKSRRS